MTTPRFLPSQAHKKFTRTDGNLTLNSGSWADLPTIGTSFDITLEAQVGDDIEAGINARFGSEAFFAALDVVTIVSAAYVSSFSTQSTSRPSAGAGAWRGISGSQVEASGSLLYTVTSGDLNADGTITLRVQYSEAAAGNKTLYAGTAVAPFQFWAKNIGPADAY